MELRANALRLFKATLCVKRDMDYKILTTAAIVILGWFVVHLLSQYREKINKRREKRIEYLIAAYRNLERSANIVNSNEVKDGVESAIADIHLFGSEEQIELVQEFSNSIANEGHASMDSLLLQLREDLRKELRLSKVPKSLNYLRLKRD